MMELIARVRSRLSRFKASALGLALDVVVSVGLGVVVLVLALLVNAGIVGALGCGAMVGVCTYIGLRGG